MNFRKIQYLKDLAKIQAKVDMLQDAFSCGAIRESTFIIELNKHILDAKELNYNYEHPPQNTYKTPILPSIESIKKELGFI